MKEESKAAIKKLAEKGGEAGIPDTALKYTQAALNLAHVLSTLDGIERNSKQE